MKNHNRSRTAAVAGAVVGAGAVIAGTVVLSNPNNQKKVKDILDKSKVVQVRLRRNLFKKRIAIKKVASSAIDVVEKVAKVAKNNLEKI